MNRAITLWSQAVSRHEGRTSEDGRDWQERSEDTNANEILAQKIATAVLGRTLTDRELERASPAVHYLFGATMATLYGMAAEWSDRVRVGAGAAFGALLWIAADEIAIPVFGLADPERPYPLERHAQSLASHIVYGMTTELVRQLGAGRVSGDRPCR